MVAERVWLYRVGSTVGEAIHSWRRRCLLRLFEPEAVTYERDEFPGRHADVFLTLVARSV